jgi:hypothetical protein
MIGFAFVALGYLLGRRAAAALRHRGAGLRQQGLAQFGGAVAGAAAGIAVWRATADLGPEQLLLDVYDGLHSAFGDAAGLVTAALLILAVIGVLYGVCLTAALVVLFLGELLLAVLPRRHPHPDDDVDDDPAWLFGHHTDVIDRGGRVVIRSPWRTATSSYGRAVAAEIHAHTAGPVQVDVCGITDCHLHLDAEGIAAQWNSVEGWSAMTLRGRHWYPTGLVPVPAEIATWLLAVGNEPRLGVGHARRWRPEADDLDADSTEQDLLNRLIDAVEDGGAARHAA